VHLSDRNLRSFGGEKFRHRLADISPRAGYDRYLIFEFHRTYPPLLFSETGAYP
jgi:hypothetical protein